MFTSVAVTSDNTVERVKFVNANPLRSSGVRVSIR
jgi:hypothetical protein